MELYINPASFAPGVKYGPTPGVIIGDQWYYRGTLDFLVYREENVDTLVTNDISISQLGIEIFRSEKQSKLTSCRPFLFSMSP